MRHILPYVDNSQIFGISNPNYTQLIINEAEILNRAEDMIPTDVRFQLELSLLLNQGFKAVDNYHRNLVEGINTLFDTASSIVSESELFNIEKSFKSIIEELKSPRINEDVNIPTSATSIAGEYGDSDWDNVMSNIQNTTDVSGAGEGESSGMLGMLKNLLSSLSEGGSPIGILHLILDIIGLVGDLFPPVGVIADILNGLIYMFRAVYYKDSSKWILAIISFAAAAIPFAGNVFKGMLQSSKAGKNTVKVYTEYMKSGKTVTKGSVEISDEAVEILAKSGPETTEAVEYLGKTVSKSLPIVKKILDGFFKKFLGTVTGWIPIIGKPLKKFFASISDMFDVFFKKSTKMADSIPETIKIANIKKIDKFFESTAKPGRKIIEKDGKLIVTDAKGARIGDALDANILKNTDFLKSRYGSNMADDIVERTHGNVINFYKGMAENQQLFASKYGKIYGYAKRGEFKLTRNLVYFIGKSVVKLAFGANAALMSDGEIEAFGAISINQAMQNKINKNLKDNPEARYDVPIYDSIADKDAFEVLNGNLNKQAKLFNVPEIGMVTYAQNRHKDDIPEDVKAWWGFAYGDQTKEIDQIEKTITNKDKKKITESSSFRYIKRFKL